MLFDAFWQNNIERFEQLPKTKQWILFTLLNTSGDIWDAFWRAMPHNIAPGFCPFTQNRLESLWGVLKMIRGTIQVVVNVRAFFDKFASKFFRFCVESRWVAVVPRIDLSHIEWDLAKGKGREGAALCWM